MELKKGEKMKFKFDDLLKKMEEREKVSKKLLIKIREIEDEIEYNIPENILRNFEYKNITFRRISWNRGQFEEIRMSIHGRVIPDSYGLIAKSWHPGGDLNSNVIGMSSNDLIHLANNLRAYLEKLEKKLEKENKELKEGLRNIYSLNKNSRA